MYTSLSSFAFDRKYKMLLEQFQLPEERAGNGTTLYRNSSGADFWGDVGAGTFVVCTSTKRCLLGLRSNMVNEPNTWGIIGGALDVEVKSMPDILDAAKRELTEESGYDGEVEMLPSYVFKAPNGGFQYHNFIGVVKEEFKPITDWETARTAWLSATELDALQPKHFGLITLLQKDLRCRKMLEVKNY